MTERAPQYMVIKECNPLPGDGCLYTIMPGFIRRRNWLETKTIGGDSCPGMTLEEAQNVAAEQREFDEKHPGGRTRRVRVVQVGF